MDFRMSFSAHINRIGNGSIERSRFIHVVPNAGEPQVKEVCDSLAPPKPGVRGIESRENGIPRPNFVMINLAIILAEGVDGEAFFINRINGFGLNPSIDNRDNMDASLIDFL